MSTANDILIVEDDRDLADAILRALRIAGYKGRTAENGQRALEAVAATTPALILLDMLMPVMDGWQCARALRSKYGDSIPIVVVSAAEDVRKHGALIGANDVLSKPFELDDLLRLVARYVGLTPSRAAGRIEPE
jgi:two-component system response regulator MprA